MSMVTGRLLLLAGAHLLGRIAERMNQPALAGQMVLPERWQARTSNLEKVTIV